MCLTLSYSGLKSGQHVRHEGKKLNCLHLIPSQNNELKWKGKITKFEVPQLATLLSMTVTQSGRRLRRLEHVTRMDGSRTPKHVLYGRKEVTWCMAGRRSHGRPKLKYKDICKSLARDFSTRHEVW